MTDKARRQFEGAEGVTLAADVYGSSNARTVILAHGAGQTRHAWGKTAEQLAARGSTAVALDLRGHGDSDWSPTGSYQIELFADDLLAVARAFDEPPHLVGASLGGLSALLCLAESDAKAFASLTLVDITPTMVQSGVDRVLGFMRQNADQGFGSLEEAAEIIAQYLPHRPKRKTLDGLKKNLRRHDDGRYRWHWDPRFIDSIFEARAESSPDRLVEAARTLRLPTFLIRGRSSELVTEKAVQEFLQMVPHAEYTDISGASHMVAGDQNDAFTDAVSAFIERFR